MKEHYVSYEQSVKLKVFGFDEPCENVYSQRLPNHEPFSKRDDAVRYFQLTGNSLFTETLYSAPRLDQAQAWMRDCKGIHISLNPYSINPDRYDGDNYFWSFELFQVPTGGWLKVNEGGFDTYELALSVGLDKALELLGKEVKE